MAPISSFCHFRVSNPTGILKSFSFIYLVRILVINLLLSILLAAGCGSPSKPSIRSCMRSIWEAPNDSVVIERDVTDIWQQLLKAFPEDEFTRSVTFDELRNGLPEAIRSGRPYVIAFAPDTVRKSEGRWSWTTYFRELAGYGTTLEFMSPNITTPNGDVYSFGYGDNKMTQSVSFWAFGKGSYGWWCDGDFTGSSVALDYENGLVTSYTTLY